MKHYDFLIVGQGLAGSLLAWRLIRAGQRVMVVDTHFPGAASRVAAGLVNPVTGRRLVKEQQVEQYLASAQEVYHTLSVQFGKIFFHDKPMLRLFDSDSLIKAWQKRRKDPLYRPFVGDLPASLPDAYPQGGFLQHRSGYLNVSLLLDSLRQYLFEHAALVNTPFVYHELQVTGLPRWRDITANKVIFCEGARVTENPWFNGLPMQPAQGEILTLHTNEVLPEWIINGGKWLLPLDHGRFKLGATYVWPSADKPLNGQISQEGKSALLAAMHKLFPALRDYTIQAHEAGIRPTSRDKRPLIGMHPQNPRLGLFNGFGSRGSLLIPFYAAHFVDVLLNGTQLAAEVDLQRGMK